MKVNKDCLLSYLAQAPCALAFERTLECQIYAELPFARPVLDLGCGEGLFARVLFAEKIDTGIDPNPRDLARARALGVYDELIECSGAAIPKPAGVYRTIFSNSVLEHIPDLEPVFREVYRLLAPGGRFYVTVPSNRFDQFTVVNQLLTACGLTRQATRYRTLYNSFWKHYHCYSLETWETLARRCGFNVVDSHTYDPRYVCMVNDLLVPLALPSYLTKRLTNRWTLFPGIRRIMVYPIYLLAKRALRGASEAADGGLVFMALVKADAADRRAEHRRAAHRRVTQ